MQSAVSTSAYHANPASDLVFAGRCEVVVIDGRHDFVAHPGTGETPETYLAGSYANAVDPSQLKFEQAGDLFGHFVLLRHSKGTHSLSIATDRFGMFPFYWARRADRLFLSTNLSTFVKRGILDRQVDVAGLSDILAFNVPTDQRTPWLGATSFAGGTAVTINLDTLDHHSRRLWKPIDLLRNADTSFDSVKDQLVEVFLEGTALASRGRSNVAITLSGGADSRCLLAALLHAGHKAVTYSTGVPGSRALDYARQMAELCRVPHHSHPLDGAFLKAYPALLQQSVLLNDGMSFSSEVEASWLRDHVASGDVLLHGAFAELFKIGQMHSFHYDARSARLSGNALADNLWKRFSVQYAPRRNAFCAALREQLDEQARQHLEDKVNRYQADLDADGVLQMLYIDEHLGKVAKYSRVVWAHRIPVYFPFAYPPLVDLMLRVRTKDKIEERFVTYLLKRTNRLLARFPDSNTGAPIGASYLRREAIHVVDWLQARLFGSKASADHQDFASWLSHMQPPIEQVLAELQSATGLFESSQVDVLIDRCRTGDQLAAWTLNFLWAWGLWRTASARPLLAQ